MLLIKLEANIQVTVMSLLIKKVINLISKPLTNIFNKSFTT